MTVGNFNYEEKGKIYNHCSKNSIGKTESNNRICVLDIFDILHF